MIEAAKSGFVTSFASPVNGKSLLNQVKYLEEELKYSLLISTSYKGHEWLFVPQTPK